uniref:HNH nuclease domain-containing protein n=1 Tax=viral metagenome TaxID=1070528 RepID=A0A6C0HBF9_9ZZZZ
MRFEIILFLIAGFIMANIYTDGKYMRIALSWKKYYQMAGVAIGALMIYWLIRRKPAQAREMLSASNDYLKYLPVDKNTSSIISPILDFTTKQNILADQYWGSYSQQDGGYNYPVVPMRQQHSEKRILTSGKQPTKRSVSETKKKYVASSQNWKCGGCGKQLTAWFEVDHKVRLEYGGSNEVSNLVALCRECHGEKTTMENL